MAEEIGKEGKKSNWTTTIISIIILIIIGGGVYLWTDNQTGHFGQDEKLNQSFITGYNAGALDIITYIADQTSQCRQVPLNVSGIITTVVSVDCLR